jgi:HlyD family secretion protein
MIRSRTKRTSWVAVSALGAAAMIAAVAHSVGAQQQAARGAADEKNWEAVAPGLVEPGSGEINMLAPVIGRISGVLVSVGDKVAVGEPLVRLNDEEARARVATAHAQYSMRKRARNDQSAGKAADRRRAEDALADAETALVEARDAFDKAAIAKRSATGSDADLAAARTAWTTAQDGVAQRQVQLRKVEVDSGTPLPTQSEGGLNVARTELWLAVVQLDTLTIRAPIASTVLQVNAKVGELAAPSSPRPLVAVGDLSALRVRAELDERDIGKIKLGDKVVVRADAFHDREFAGKVSAIAPLVQAGRISASGGRNLTDYSVTEVLIDLADSSPLLVGMKVDVYFQPGKAAQ